MAGVFAASSPCRSKRSRRDRHAGQRHQRSTRAARGGSREAGHDSGSRSCSPGAQRGAPFSHTQFGLSFASSPSRSCQRLLRAAASVEAAARGDLPDGARRRLHPCRRDRRIYRYRLKSDTLNARDLRADRGLDRRAANCPHPGVPTSSVSAASSSNTRSIPTWGKLRDTR